MNKCVHYFYTVYLLCIAVFAFNYKVTWDTFQYYVLTGNHSNSSNGYKYINYNGTNKSGMIMKSNYVTEQENNTAIILLWTFVYVKTIGISTLLSEGKTFTPCDTCQLKVTKDRSLLNISSVIIFTFEFIHFNQMPKMRYEWQYWAMLTHESPYHSRGNGYRKGNINFNWTLTFHRESDIFIPYGSYVQHNNMANKNNIIQNLDIVNVHRRQSNLSHFQSYEEGKTYVLWVVSKCGSIIRMKYVKELRKHIKVDIFGRCGKKHPCKKYDFVCEEKLWKKYKFYLSFENSICEDYLTEKVYKPLNYGILPVAMGSDIESYTKWLPPNSFLHVDNFTSVKHLADYMQHLSSDIKAYRRYFHWTTKWTVIRWVNAQAWLCELCNKLQLKGKKTHNTLVKKWSMKKLCPLHMKHLKQTSYYN